MTLAQTRAVCRTSLGLVVDWPQFSWAAGGNLLLKRDYKQSTLERRRKSGRQDSHSWVSPGPGTQGWGWGWQEHEEMFWRNFLTA